MYTRTLVGTPHPDDNHPTTDSAAHADTGRAIDSRVTGHPAITAMAILLDPDPGPDTAAPGPVVEAVIVDDPDDEDGEPRVPVNRPAPRGAGEMLPWRRDIERRSIIAPWLKRWDDVRAAARWLLGWVWHATGHHLIRLPLYTVKLTARAPRGVLVAAARLRGWVGDAESLPLRETAIRAGESDQYLRVRDPEPLRRRGQRRHHHLRLVDLPRPTRPLCGPAVRPAGPRRSGPAKPRPRRTCANAGHSA